jgi:hypothetical protein
MDEKYEIRMQIAEIKILGEVTGCVLKRPSKTLNLTRTLHKN